MVPQSSLMMRLQRSEDDDEWEVDDTMYDVEEIDNIVPVLIE